MNDIPTMNDIQMKEYDKDTDGNRCSVRRVNPKCVNNKYSKCSTFLNFVTEQEDLISTLHAATVFVNTADTQLSCVWGTCRTASEIIS